MGDAASDRDKIVDATLMIGWYGRIVRHPWLSPDWAEEDMYSLFAAGAEAMGWSSSGPGDDDGLWGMNDAGQDRAGGATTRLAWFQVGLPTHRAGGPRPLPLQPLATCSWDAVARIGDVAADGVQFLVPLQLAGPSAGRLEAGLNPFHAADPAARTAATVTVDTGSNDIGRRRAKDLLEGMAALRTGPFRVTGPVRIAPTVDAPQPPLVGDMWMGPSRHPVEFDADLPEWTPDALGWLALLVAEGARRAGIATTALVGISREGAAGPGGRRR
ncbi:hypothetical protein [Pseudonocardia sp.]|uniref:hypothetical protein n=1 Tax=Pseudonocardia sp. TaxID=60912 RepID=UPI002603E121|nr:hypothetical protein [Pseudonocardia sp.]